MTATFKINGQPYTVNLATLPPDITLNTFIREHAQLTATKFMCLEGGCGVCVVAVKGKHPVTGEVKTWAANSCLTLLNTCVDWEIITNEGIGNKHIGYHPIQKRMAKMNGSQCGFCTSGFIMNMYSLMESKGAKLCMTEVENSFGGNICRCTGYRPILDAMKSFAVDSTIKIPTECQDIEELSFKKICPKTLQQCAGLCHKPVQSINYEDGCEWHWPKCLNELFDILSKIKVNIEYMLVAGNTAHGVYRRSEKIRHFIDVNAIVDLKMYELTSEKLRLGANLSLTETMDIFKEAMKKPGFEYCEQLWNHFDLIAHVPVRNNGTLAGNISTKKKYPEFPSDIFLTFETLDAQVVINLDAKQQETQSLTQFLQDNRPKIVLFAFELKAYPKNKFIFKSYKIMPRAQNAHAFVNAGFLFDVEKSGKVNNARICFGGIAPDFVHALSIEKLLKDQVFHDKAVVEKIFAELPNILQPNDVLPDPSPEYRRKLACGLMLKCLLDISPSDKVKPSFKSGGPILKRALSSGSQVYQTQKKNYPLTEPLQKVEALIQCTGEATYMNDVYSLENSVHCAFVNATKVGASIEQIDAAEALKYPGVIAFYSAKDIPGVNTVVGTEFGYTVEELFTGEIVRYYDQPLGMIVATTSDIANRAAAKIKVIYSNGSNVVMSTLEDVFANNRMDRIHTVAPSSGGKKLKLTDNADIVGHGILEMGLQYHFTMEPQTCVAVPFEEGLQVWATTQWIDHTQSVISKMLQIKAADVQMKVRRLGGGYGSKISRGNAVACAASLAAYKLNRPARFVQTIESMMNSNGKRWGCRSDYEFHIKSNGKIVGLKNTFYEDAGFTLNENPVPELSILCARNCYNFTVDNYKLEGNAVLTDATSNAWCRAPGSVEGIAMIENIMEHIAFEANVDPADVRLLNLMPGHKMNELLPRFLKSTEYKKRQEEICSYNDKNRWKKKGLGLAVIDYPLRYFGQFTATVSIYHADGSVVISHGGIEMGQGMNTKVTQVAAYQLGIPVELVKIEASDSLNGANSTVTGGSVGSESVCFAVRKACTTLNDRLKPVKDSLKNKPSWAEIVQAAWIKNINLIASDHFKEGDMKNYNIYGLCLTEVEVDVLTGNILVERVDILEDAGESLNPYVDIGQIEGAFVMCLGYWLTEQLIYDRTTGQLLTNRTWNYKPPGAKDIPIDFRIELLPGNPNPGGFLRSKSTGEPPSCLAISAMFAKRQALYSARKDAGLKREWVRFGAPTTPETFVLNAGNDVSTFSLE